jgi:biotin carboxylase
VVLLRRANGDGVKRVLLVATTTGYQIRAFGEAAASLGIRLVFASDRCDQLDDPWWDQAIPVRFHDEARSVEAVRAACAGTPLDGVIAVGDRPAVLAARIAFAFGLPGHPPGGAVVSRNKLATRMALRSAGLPTPAFLAAPLDGNPIALARRLRYPVVVKPLALSGSRGVVRADTEAELLVAFERLRRVLAAPDVRFERDEVHRQVLIESFIPGVEYAVEALLTHGSLQTLAIIDKPDPLDGPLFEETIYRMPSAAPPSTQAGIAAAVSRACAAIGLRHGPVHAECRVQTDDEGSVCVYILEVAARPIGGLCSRALRFATDVPLEAVLLRHAIGEDVSCYTREATASGVMMIPIPRRGIYRGVKGIDAAKAVSGVADVRITAKPDTVLVPLPDARSYLGFIFARGTEPADVDRALREAHARLEFQVERELAVL